MTDTPEEPIPDWEFAGREEDRIRGAQEHAYARGLAAGRAAAIPDPPDDLEISPGDVTPGLPKGEKCPTCGLTRWEGKQIDGWLKAGPEAAASPDERLRQRLAGLDTVEVQESALDDPETFVRKADLDAALAEAPGSPDERLREAAAWLVELAAAAVCEPRRFAENETELQWKAADAITATRAALAAVDREAPDEGDVAIERLGRAVIDANRRGPIPPVSDEPKETTT